MDDLVASLRAMARHEHDDLSIADLAADEIIMLRERLKIRDEEITFLKADLKDAYRGAVSFEEAIK